MFGADIISLFLPFIRLEDPSFPGTIKRKKKIKWGWKKNGGIYEKRTKNKLTWENRKNVLFENVIEVSRETCRPVEKFEKFEIKDYFFFSDELFDVDQNIWWITLNLITMPMICFLKRQNQNEYVIIINIIEFQ